MDDQLVKARGHFWWGDEVIPEGCFAPPGGVTGEIEISQSGRIRLRLDSTLGLVGERLFSRHPAGRPICGILIGTNKYARLMEVNAAGSSISDAGPSTEAFAAQYCLVSSAPFASAEPRFKCLQMSLDGYEEWLRLYSIKVTGRSRAATARYRRPKQRTWELDIGRLALTTYLLGRMGGRHSAVTFTEIPHLQFTSAAPMNVERAARLSARIEDLMMIVTDNKHGIDFPILKAGPRSRSVQLYYARMERVTGSTEPVEFIDCWTRFPLIADAFGLIVENWLKKHELYGPGFHLYVGNQRQRQLYPEHRFASLMWGLESLVRQLPLVTWESPLQAKVARIVAQICKSRDRKWAEDQLRHALEPSLAMRLYEAFNTLPFDLDKKEMENFTKHCAERRNDLSHVGGSREPGTYRKFLEDILKLSRALDYLYHAKLLQLIGLPEDQLRWSFTESFQSYAIQKTLEVVGLTLTRTKDISA